MKGNPTMIESTQCFICRNDEILMMYRNKKAKDPNEGKWVGIGGKVEKNESASEANVREVKEETGILLSEQECRFCGVVYFKNTVWNDEKIYLYLANVDGSIQFSDCDEGELHWIDKDRILSLNLWEGDRIFLEPLLKGKTGIEITLYYEGDRLMRVENQAPGSPDQ